MSVTILRYYPFSFNAPLARPGLARLIPLIYISIMPARNRTKIYSENSYYHIYNRGVEKRLIFLDQQDYAVFLHYLKEYLLPKNEKDLREQLSNPNTSYKEKDKIIKLLRLNNFADEITLLAYCLMPNHFHFFIKQTSSQSIDKFMNSLCTRYTMYFNRKHKRVGSLYQGVYKAVSINQENQFIYLSKYIHKQSKLHSTNLQGQALRGWEQPSSYPEYLGKRKAEWIHPEEILDHFSKTNPNLTYKAFVEEKDDFSIIQNKTLEEE
ncbi:MAG: transposase [Candidatus Daviesbacteria bacterium]|nr:transposase [Candidatus Daviesbacteria bacterium]